MKDEYKIILEWLIEDIDFSNKRDLFGNEFEKEITADQEIMDIFEIEKITFRKANLIRRIGTTIYYYPLIVHEYLKSAQ